MRTISALALTSAIFVSAITGVLLFLVTAMDTKTLLATGGIVFVVSFLLAFLGFKYFSFTEANDIYRKIDALLPKGKKQHMGRYPSSPIDLLSDIYERIGSFTQLKQKEIDNLKRLEASRTEFVADVSHELKTPIFAAQGLMHTLLDGAVDDDKVRVKFIKKAAKNLDRLNALVQDILTLSQIEMGSVKMKFDNIDLYRLCVEVVEEFEQRKTTQPVPIIVRPPPSSQLIIVRADWLRIVQVMTNLISNAVKYTGETGSVTVYFSLDQGAVTTFVRDTGIGIPATHLNQIFQRFYRVDKSRNRQRGGTGLGLSIVKHILEEHDTTIEVKSEVGRGSTFSFKLPMVNPSVSPLLIPKAH